MKHRVCVKALSQMKRVAHRQCLGQLLSVSIPAMTLPTAWLQFCTTTPSPTHCPPRSTRCMAAQWLACFLCCSLLQLLLYCVAVACFVVWPCFACCDKNGLRVGDARWRRRAVDHSTTATTPVRKNSVYTMLTQWVAKKAEAATQMIV